MQIQCGLMRYIVLYIIPSLLFFFSRVVPVEANNELHHGVDRLGGFVYTWSYNVLLQCCV